MFKPDQVENNLTCSMYQMYLQCNVQECTFVCTFLQKNNDQYLEINLKLVKIVI